MSDIDEGVEAEEGGFDRRRFLLQAAAAGGVAWAAPSITTFALSPAAATPCGIPGPGSSAPAETPAPVEDMDMSSQGAPCLHSCNEVQVQCETTANDQLDACAQAAGTDTARLTRCASTFLDQVVACSSNWQDCSEGCA